MDHHPNQILLQNAITNIGRAEYLVQTLSGLASLSQTASDIEKTLAINPSTVLAMQYPTICYCISVNSCPQLRLTLSQPAILSSRAELLDSVKYYV
jgi:hypothetical protein